LGVVPGVALGVSNTTIEMLIERLG
jgi:hypothetical protein